MTPRKTFKLVQEELERRDLLAIDLHVPSITLDSSAYIGSVAQVQYQVQNIGDTSQEVDIQFVLSRDRIRGSNDFIFHGTTVDSTANLTNSATTSVSIPEWYGENNEIGSNYFLDALPLEPGSYYIGVHVDPNNAISETNEGNNFSFSTTPIQLQVVPAQAGSGRSILVIPMAYPDSPSTFDASDFRERMVAVDTYFRHNSYGEVSYPANLTTITPIIEVSSPLSSYTGDGAAVEAESIAFSQGWNRNDFDHLIVVNAVDGRSNSFIH